VAAGPEHGRVDDPTLQASTGDEAGISADLPVHALMPQRLVLVLVPVPVPVSESSRYERRPEIGEAPPQTDELSPSGSET
jgi:hypothetical protein